VPNKWLHSSFLDLKNAIFKHQITNKSQIPISNDQNLKPEIGKRKEEGV
jgi:hypothetical protein